MILKKKSIKKYKAFHGKNPRAARKKIFHVPENLVLLGKAHQIVYISNKKNGGGDGKECEYIHTFETPCNLYMDETGRKQFYIMGARLKVTHHGIEN